MPQQILPLVRIRTTFLILIVVIFSFSPLIAVPGTDCAAKQQALTSAKSRVKADQNSIRQLKAGATASDLEKWANAAEEERREVLKDSIVNSMGIIADGLMTSTDAAKDALKPMNISGVYLPHGVGSLGTGQANLIIGRLQRLGSASPQVQTLIDNVRVLSSFQNKTETLEFAAKVHDIASVYKESTDFATSLTDASSSDPVKVAAVGLQLVSGLAGKGATISVDVGEALFTGVEHLTDAYLISSIIDNLSNPTGKQDITEAELAGVKVLARKLERDVKALQDAKAQMGNCQTCQDDLDGGGQLEGTWSVSLRDLQGSFPPEQDTFILTKVGACKFRLVFGSTLKGSECPGPFDRISKTAPTSYEGSETATHGCNPRTISLQLERGVLTFKYTVKGDYGTSSFVGTGHPVSP
jgi:hypothetical protein